MVVCSLSGSHENIKNLATATHAEDGFFADPSGWTSETAARDNTKHLLGSVLGVQPSDIENIFEEKDLDHLIFTSRCSGSDVFYLSVVEVGRYTRWSSPARRKNCGVFCSSDDDWRGRLALKEL